MDRRSPHPLPPTRPTIATLPGQPAAQPAAEPPPARRWSWSLEPDALLDAGGDEWWAALRPLPLEREESASAKQACKPAPPPATAPEVGARPHHPAPDGAVDVAPCSSFPPPALTTEVLEVPTPARRWVMPALVMAGALAVVLGSAVSESAADGSGQAAALQQTGDTPSVADLPTLHARVALAQLGATARLQIDQASGATQAPPSRLVVSSALPCAQIWLDARNRGSGQGRTFVVSPGAHAVACRLPSGKMMVRRAVVAEGRSTTVFFAP